MRFKLLNFDQVIDHDNIIKVSDMVIKEKSNKSDTNVLAPGGIFCEEIFGKSMGDSVEYSCSCKATNGKFALNVVCTECGTPVIKKESFVKKQGWIDLGDHGIINPLLFKFTERIIGKLNFKRIISSEHILDMDGNVIDGEDDKTTKKLKDLNILNIGVRAFCDSFIDIIQLFVTPDNQNLFDFILANSDKYVIHSLPVISQRLRPALIIGNEFKFDKINNLYIRIIACSNSLKEEHSNSSIVVDPIVGSIQNFANQLHDKIIEAIGGKEGWMRNNLMSNRVNFSSRAVISPLRVGSALDEIHIPYLTAVELLKFHLIRLLLPLYSYSYYKALAVWKRATLQFDQEIYDLINLILMKEKGGLQMVINRNPTISFGSILAMRVGRVKSDFNDLTMSIPNNVLRLIAGDYDGDVLSIFLIPDQDYKEHFKPLNPINMMISVNHGRYSDNLTLDKDYQLGFYSLLS